MRRKKNESAFISIILYIKIHLQEAFGEEGMVVGRGSACLIGMTDYIHVVISIRVWVCVFVSSLRCGVVYTCWCVSFPVCNDDDDAFHVCLFA